MENAETMQDLLDRIPLHCRNCASRKEFYCRSYRKTILEWDCSEHVLFTHWLDLRSQTDH